MTKTSTTADDLFGRSLLALTFALATIIYFWISAPLDTNSLMSSWNLISRHPNSLHIAQVVYSENKEHSLQLSNRGQLYIRSGMERFNISNEDVIDNGPYQLLVTNQLTIISLRDKSVLWQVPTGYSTCNSPKCILRMQNDRNLVFYDWRKECVWASGTILPHSQ